MRIARWVAIAVLGFAALVLAPLGFVLYAMAVDSDCSAACDGRTAQRLLLAALISSLVAWFVPKRPLRTNWIPIGLVPLSATCVLAVGLSAAAFVPSRFWLSIYWAFK